MARWWRIPRLGNSRDAIGLLKYVQVCTFHMQGEGPVSILLATGGVADLLPSRLCSLCASRHFPYMFPSQTSRGLHTGIGSWVETWRKSGWDVLGSGSHHLLPRGTRDNWRYTLCRDLHARRAHSQTVSVEQAPGLSEYTLGTAEDTNVFLEPFSCWVLDTREGLQVCK